VTLLCSRRRRFDDTITQCTEQLSVNPLDKAVWFIKLKALTGKAFVDDMDMEEEGVAEILMDENAMQKAPRPGTSLRRPMSGAVGPGGGPNAGIRPMSSSGRPLSGFARPGTQSRGSTGRAEDAFKGARPGTSRPMSVAGRFVRLGTQSMLNADGDQFINPDRLDCVKYSTRPAESKAILDYLLYHDHNPKKALELAAECTKVTEFKDWWWKSRLGKIYYQLAMYREAEKQFKSSIRHQDMICTYLELSKIYLKLDQPNTALDNYMKASEKYSGDVSLILGIARVYDALNDLARGVQYYKKVLHYDASNVEAIACLASHHFYTDQPEIALRFYRRLLQMGVNNTELWSNIGLCCFYASQYDMTLAALEKAITLATDDNMSDVWYNVGQIAIGIGDLNLAYQAFKIAISVDANHAESFNNLGVRPSRHNTYRARDRDRMVILADKSCVLRSFAVSRFLSCARATSSKLVRTFRPH
jgi:tetratricopeptide repeat protein 8